MIVALYARYSSDNQRAESIVAQLRACREYCQKYGYTIIKEYADEAMTGTNDRRPQFQQMLHDAEAGLFEMVIAHKVDRIGRNEFEYYSNRHRLEACGVQVAFAAQGFDVSTPEGGLMNNMLIGLAAYYSRNLSKEVKKGQRENVMQGKTTGGKPLFGYRYTSDKRYEIDEYEAAAVRLLFDMYIKGYGYLQIADRLNGMGYRTRKGNLFGKNSLHDLLVNRRYIGTAILGKNFMPPSGRRNSHRPDHDNMLVVENVCPAIIDKETFKEAQEQMQQRKNRKGANSAKHDYLLTGLIMCSHCGCAMTGSTSSKKDGTEHRYYRCPKKTRLGTHVCPNRSVRADMLEKLVIKQIQEFFLDPDTLDKVMDDVDARYREMLEKIEGEIAELRKKLASADKKIEHFYDGVCETGRIDEKAKEYYARIKEEYDRYKAQLEEKENSRPANISKKTIRKYIERYRREMETGKAPNLKGAIAAFVQKITVCDSTITVTYRFQPTPDKMEQLDLYGAPGGSRTHAFSSGG